MNTFSRLLLVLVSWASSLAFAHGMDKPGPHGGYVRMPGAFHTEIVPSSDNVWNVYLLDDNLKNATNQNSSVSGFVQIGKEKLPLVCEVKEDHFVCSLVNNAPKSNRSQLRLEAKRNAGVMGIAIYKLPLSWRP